MTDEPGSLTTDQLAEARKAAKTLFDSGVLTPHEKQHIWTALMRIGGQVREAAEPRQDHH